MGAWSRRRGVEAASGGFTDVGACDSVCVLYGKVARSFRMCFSPLLCPVLEPSAFDVVEQLERFVQLERSM